MNIIDVCKGKKVYMVSDADLDGIACRVLGEYYLAPICKYLPLNTVERDMRDFSWEIAQDADIIIFTDITPNDKEVIDKLLTQYSKTVYIFDHHQTGMDILGEQPNYYYDINKCACNIFFDVITSGIRTKRVISQFVELVNTYDMWNDRSLLWQQAKDLHNIMYAYINWRLHSKQTDTERFNKFIAIQLQKFRTFKKFYFTAYEQGLAVKAKAKEESSYKIAKKNLQIRVDSSGNTYIYTYCPSKISFVGHRLLAEYNPSYLIIRSTWKGDLNKKISLRSANKIDVAKIAEKYGGGGHKNAAGIELSEEQLFQLNNGDFHLI